MKKLWKPLLVAVLLLSTLVAGCDGQEASRADGDLILLEYEEMEVYGTLESRSGGSLVVDRMTYLITSETEFDDEVETGDYVMVKYYENEDGDLILLEIEGEDYDDGYDYEEMEAYGTLVSMSEGSLVVDGVTYLITSETEFDDEVETGYYVMVKYYENNDGDLILLEIEGEDYDDDYDYEEMEAYGTLESRSGGSLVVDGMTYLITSETEFDDEVKTGGYVMVKYYENRDGDLILVSIDSKDYDYEEMEAYGTLDSRSGGSLVVDGMTYLITSETEFDDEVKTGGYVMVKYYENRDGDLILVSIDSKDYDDDSEDYD